jgi:hypothetical protein
LAQGATTLEKNGAAPAVRSPCTAAATGVEGLTVHFFSEGPRRPRPFQERPFLRYLLAAFCATTAYASTLPWTRVKFAHLHGVSGNDGAGPAGWHTCAGFTCLMTALLNCVLLAVETPSAAARAATRPAAFLLLLVASIVLLFQLGREVPRVLGVTGEYTAWHAVAVTGTFAATLGAALRLLPTRSDLRA